MRVYKNRRDKSYLKALEEKLQLDGPRGVRSTAVDIAEPRLTKDGTFKRCCRLDFLGISASTLVDLAGDIVPTSVAKHVRALFEHAPELNKDGIFVKMRFLLAYPYSAAAISRIQAETTRQRASMAEPRYVRNLEWLERVDERTFNQSDLMRAQAITLEHLQAWVDEYKWTTTTTNRIEIRFVPVSLNCCTLILNDTVFTDAYLLAKEQREARRCGALSPLVKIEEPRDPLPFSAHVDHFRYLWDLDVTLTCRDATFYQPGKPGTLATLKAPSVVTFHEKAERIRKRTNASDDEIRNWEFTAQQLLSRFTMDPKPTPSSQSVFITCSWTNGDGENPALPNDEARRLADYLDEDFGRKQTRPLLSVLIVEGVAGDFLTRLIYSKLEDATLGLVIMTADYTAEKKKFSRPNIYHELGYLMRKLGPKKIALVSEKGVQIPSNVGDLVRIEFQKGRIALTYYKVLDWVARNCGIGEADLTRAAESHKHRLQDLVVEGEISSGVAKTAITRLAALTQDRKV